MAIERKISIKTKPGGGTPRVTFDPNPIAAHPGDQIFWANEDTQPHWPGRPNGDGTINTTFYMPNQIAPSGDVSAGFSPMVPGTLNYQCSLAGHQNETGSITVS